MDCGAQIRTGRSRSRAALLRQPGARRARRERCEKEIAGCARDALRVRYERLAPRLAPHLGVAGLLVDQRDFDCAIAALGEKPVPALREIVPDLAALQRQRL